MTQVGARELQVAGVVKEILGLWLLGEEAGSWGWGGDVDWGGAVLRLVQGLDWHGAVSWG